MSRRNECLQATLRVLEAAHIGYVVRHGGKHLKIVFVINGRSRTCVCPVTSSDVNAQHNQRAQIRRMIREQANV
jgi:hypothetical protein